jgi:hypothetical protein
MLTEVILHRTMLIAHVLLDKRGVGIEIEIPKSSSNHRNQVTSAVTKDISLNSTFALEVKNPWQVPRAEEELDPSTED